MHDVAAKRESGLFNGGTASQRDERTHPEGTRQRAAANQVTEATPRPGRRAKQDPKVSAGRHDRLR